MINNNFQRLSNQLKMLIQDEQVKQNIESSLSQRIRRILQTQRTILNQNFNITNDQILIDNNNHSNLQHQKNIDHKNGSVLQNKSEKMNREFTKCNSNNNKTSKIKIQARIIHKNENEDKNNTKAYLKPCKNMNRRDKVRIKTDQELNQSKQSKTEKQENSINVKQPKSCRNQNNLFRQVNLDRILKSKSKSKQKYFAKGKAQQNKVSHSILKSMSSKTRLYSSKSKYQLSSKCLNTSNSQQKTKNNQNEVSDINSMSYKSLKTQLQIIEMDKQNFIEEKQRLVNLQKCKLQKQIKQTKNMINHEKLYLQKSNNEINEVCIKIDQAQKQEKKHAQNLNLFNKKKQKHLKEVNHLSNWLVQSNQKRLAISRSISEESQLIKMYQAVIEEIKNQLKIQTNDKNQIKKELNTLNNNLVMIQNKKIIKQQNTSEVIRNIQNSIKKWM